MDNLTKEQVAAVKGRGFLRNRGTDRFSGRAVSAGGVFTAEQLRRIAECAERFGSGRVAVTSRQAAEIVGIPYDKIEEACAFLEDGSGIVFGGTGPKIRPITACKGTTCVFGRGDTQALAREIHERYYVGWSGVKLPHKFKIGVGGCPNSCVKPSLNDLGIELTLKDQEPHCILYVGGMWGKQTRVGDRLEQLVKPDELFAVLDKVLAWYQASAETGERFAKTIDRVGLAALEAAL